MSALGLRVWLAVLLAGALFLAAGAASAQSLLGRTIEAEAADSLGTPWLQPGSAIVSDPDVEFVGGLGAPASAITGGLAGPASEVVLEIQLSAASIVVRIEEVAVAATSLPASSLPIIVLTDASPGLVGTLAGVTWEQGVLPYEVTSLGPDSVTLGPTAGVVLVQLQPQQVLFSVDGAVPLTVSALGTIQPGSTVSLQIPLPFSVVTHDSGSNVQEIAFTAADAEIQIAATPTGDYHPFTITQGHAAIGSLTYQGIPIPSASIDLGSGGGAIDFGTGAVSFEAYGTASSLGIGSLPGHVYGSGRLTSATTIELRTDGVAEATPFDLPAIRGWGFGLLAVALGSLGLGLLFARRRAPPAPASGARPRSGGLC